MRGGGVDVCVCVGYIYLYVCGGGYAGAHSCGSQVLFLRHCPLLFEKLQITKNFRLVNKQATGICLSPPPQWDYKCLQQVDSGDLIRLSGS